MRGKLARQVRAEQLDAALALQPDLASLLSGLNDMLRRTVDVGAVAGELDFMVGALRDAGADVLMFTLPDPVPINPLARVAATHLVRLNAEIHAIAAARGAFVVDLAAHPVSSDRRLWNEDRLHANSEGHRRIAAGRRARARRSRTPTSPGRTSSPTRSGAAGRTTTRSGSAATSRPG